VNAINIPKNESEIILIKITRAALGILSSNNNMGMHAKSVARTEEIIDRNKILNIKPVIFNPAILWVSHILEHNAINSMKKALIKTE
jgi:hypothetical protein